LRIAQGFSRGNRRPVPEAGIVLREIGSNRVSITEPLVILLAPWSYRPAGAGLQAGIPLLGLVTDARLATEAALVCILKEESAD